jgi:PAS domain S-box-containing protein
MKNTWMPKEEGYNIKRHRSRPTIGLVMCRPLTDSRAFQVWSGVYDATRQHDINVICFPLNTHDKRDQDNILLDLVNTQILQGLAFYHWWEAEAEFEQVVAPYRSVPIVSITRLFEKYYGVIDDNYAGMRLAAQHLVEVHGRRRLAYIHGPESCRPSKKRFQGYLDVLAEQGIMVDSQLLTPHASVTPHRGAEAISLLIDTRKLRPGRDFDAVVARSDELALSAMMELRRRGVQVPYDVAVVGYDGIDECRTAIPPLTSVLLPFYELGQRTVAMLADIIAGKPLSEKHVILPVQLIVRQSCGCVSPEIRQATVGPVMTTNAMGAAIPGTLRNVILADIAQTAGDHSFPPDWIGQLLESFTAELNRKPRGVFLQALDKVLRQVVETGRDMSVWQNVVSALRRHILPHLDLEARCLAEDLWQQARVMVEEISRWAQARQTEQVEKQAEFLREIGQSLITTFDTNTLMEYLTCQLPYLGIPAGYLSLYDDPESPAASARLIMAYNQHGRVELPVGGVSFFSPQLAPEGMLPQNRWYSLIVKPLYFQKEQIGFALFETGLREKNVYEILRGEISSALQGALLVQRVQERSAEIARQKYILDTFMATVPDSIYFKDRESRFTKINNALAILFGLASPAEALGKTDFDVFPEEDARPKYEQEQEIIRTGKPLLAMEEPDAGGRWALTTKMPLRDEHGNIIGTFGISRDITALKQAQAEIEQRSLELAAAYEEIQILNSQLQEENLRMTAELDIARCLQEMILPSSQELQQIEDLEIVGYMKPADEVGGDYYDVLKEHDTIHIGIGDVTGHGLESGILMLMTQTAIRTLIEHGETNPVAFVNTLNRTIYKNGRRMGMDKTLTFSLVNYRHGQLKIVGQHEDLLVIRRNGQLERMDTMDLGFPIGLEEEIAEWVHEAIVTLQPGDGLVLYTDGITEAENMNREMYGLERLCNFLSRNWDNSAEDLKQAVIDDVLRHIGKQKIYDDLTLVIVKQQ